MGEIDVLRAKKSKEARTMLEDLRNDLVSLKRRLENRDDSLELGRVVEAIDRVEAAINRLADFL